MQLLRLHYSKYSLPLLHFLKKNINFVCRYKKRLYICNVNKDKTDRPGCRNKKFRIMKTQDLKTTTNGIVLGGYFYNDELGMAFPATRGSFGYKADEWTANECDARFRDLKANAPKGRNGKWSYSVKQCESLGYKLEINRKLK